MPQDVFDERIAAIYDETSADRFAPEVLGPTVDRLVELADGGAALELAIGTGRVALPLHERGVEVAGIEISTAMLARLRAKPGGEAIPVTIGDMATAEIGRRFSLVYLVFNTIGNLLEQEEQAACFANAARHLAPGGCFLVEVGVPRLQELHPGERFRVFERTDTHTGIDEIDVVTQRLWSHHTWVLDGEVQQFTSAHRYVWPSELDLMARLAGLTLEHRWTDWDRSPFTAASRSHISVWRAPT